MNRLAGIVEIVPCGPQRSSAQHMQYALGELSAIIAGTVVVSENKVDTDMAVDGICQNVGRPSS